MEDKINEKSSLARTDTTFPLTFLHCDIWKNRSSNQTDCRTYSDNGTLTFANRYSINSWSHRHIVGAYSTNTRICKYTCHYYNNCQMLERFIADVNSQDNYNKYGIIRAIPVLRYYLLYHSFISYAIFRSSNIWTRVVSGPVGIRTRDSRISLLW
jgi:hypothetical protein